MSRARPITLPDGTEHWFDTNRNGEKATAFQLELLATVEDKSLDDLLDEGLSQGQVLLRLREVLHGDVIPAEVLELRRARKLLAGKQPECRICSPAGEECEGSITRHHFIPRWLMRELENYQAYAARSRCTIPICVGRHRDLHLRDDSPKSIVQYLTDHERKLAQRMLDDLHEQRPAIFELIAGGDPESYEYQLIRDYQHGEFAKHHDSMVAEELALAEA